MRDLAYDPVLGGAVVRRPVAMDGNTRVNLTDDAGKVLFPLAFVRDAHIVLWHQLCYNLGKLGPNVFTSNVSNAVVERAELCAFSKVPLFFCLKVRTEEARSRNYRCQVAVSVEHASHEMAGGVIAHGKGKEK